MRCLSRLRAEDGDEERTCQRSRVSDFLANHE